MDNLTARQKKKKKCPFLFSSELLGPVRVRFGISWSMCRGAVKHSLLYGERHTKLTFGCPDRHVVTRIDLKSAKCTERYFSPVSRQTRGGFGKTTRNNYAMSGLTLNSKTLRSELRVTAKITRAFFSPPPLPSTTTRSHFICNIALTRSDKGSNSLSDRDEKCPSCFVHASLFGDFERRLDQMETSAKRALPMRIHRAGIRNPNETPTWQIMLKLTSGGFKICSHSRDDGHELAANVSIGADKENDGGKRHRQILTCNDERMTT